MKTTYSFPILCSLNDENKITNFCTLELNNFLNNDFFSKIANELNLNFSPIFLTSPWNNSLSPASKILKIELPESE